MPAPLRVLLMSYWLEAGGTERQLAETARALDRARFDPHVACFHPEGLCADDLRAEGVPVVKFPVRSFASPSTLGAALVMRRYLRQHGIDLVHTYDVPATIFGVPAARACRVPVVISSQRAHRSLTPGIYHRLLRLTDRLADGIVVNARAIQRALILEDKVPAERIHLCYNGLRTDVFSPGLRDQPRDVARIGSLCALRPEKSLETLLEAFAQVRASFPQAELAMVGSGPALPGLEALAARLGLGPSCRFEPATRQVAERLRRMDIFVLPSRTEALSNSLMEAMACGCCAVASDVGGTPELVEDGKTGWLFRAGDVAGLRDKLCLLLSQPDLRRRCADAGASFIRENFSLQAAVRRMESIYSTLWERRRAAV
jgi:glycosyltransferase involved in cell wall biosynthesis